MNSQGRVVAAVFALSAFAIALIAGLAAGNETSTVLLRALGALIACQIIGTLAGMLVERVIKEHEVRYHADNPVPSLHAPGKVVVVDEAADETKDETIAGA